MCECLKPFTPLTKLSQHLNCVPVKPTSPPSPQQVSQGPFCVKRGVFVRQTLYLSKGSFVLIVLIDCHVYFFKLLFFFSESQMTLFSLTFVHKILCFRSFDLILDRYYIWL